MPIPHSYSYDHGVESVAAFINGELYTATSETHSNFAEINDALHYYEPTTTHELAELLDLFDTGKTVERAFERYSDRVTLVNGHVLFDGDTTQPGLSRQIVRFLDQGADVGPLVNFMEKIESNPSDHSRRQAWDWINQHDITVTPSGDIVTYKGVSRADDGGWESGFAGTATRNGELYNNRRIPNAIGDTIEMARSSVADDPDTACSTGLHVGTFSYAQAYAGGALLKVLVNPRDIVSVPRDGHGAKIRVCRYKVLDTIAQEIQEPMQRQEDDFAVGDVVCTCDGWEGTVTYVYRDGAVEVEADDNTSAYYEAEDVYLA